MGPRLTSEWPRLRPWLGGLAVKAALSCRRCLSPRLWAGRGDQLPCLQAEAATRVAALPPRGGAPRGGAASLASPVRAAARAAAPGGRTSAAGVPEVRPPRARVCAAVVLRGQLVIY